MDEFEEDLKLMGMGNRHRVVTPEGMEERFIGSQDRRRIIVLEEEEGEEGEAKEEEKEKKKKIFFVIELMSSFC